MNLLVTFGCSWTFGTRCWYDETNKESEDNMIKQKQQAVINKDKSKLIEFRKIKKANEKKYLDKLTFRALLAQRHDYNQINFASKASSNHTQMRRAQEFFNTDEWKKYNKVIVLWGITSTARGEVWVKEIPKSKFTIEERKNTVGEFKSFLYTKNSEIAKIMRESHYDNESEVRRLATNMNHWNTYFKLLGVENYWFDTFNHHNYDVTSMIFKNDKPRDLMSKLCMYEGEDNYHHSSYRIDCKIPKLLIERGILNPHSLHPTVKGHVMIADMLDKQISW